MHQNKSDNHKNNMIILIVVLIIVVVAVLVVSGYYLYKIGIQEDSEQTQTFGINPTTSSPAATNSTSLGQTYYNSRFGYSVIDPTGFSRFESQNGDGASFSKDSPAVSIGVWGSNDINNLTATQYLDQELTTLKTQAPDAKEQSWSTMNMDGCAGEKRVWQYTPTISGKQAIEEMAVCTKNNLEYGIYMTLSAGDYNTYSQVFDDMLASFKFAK